MWAWLVAAAGSPAVLPLRGQTNALPPLSPPYAELPPTFWEQHGTAMVITAFVAAVLAAAGVRRMRRPGPAVVVPPEVRARLALETLRRQPEDGAVLSQVSRVIRDYFIAAFGLAPGAWTTAEFCREVAGCTGIQSGLATEVAAFLRECDARKFATVKEPGTMDAANRALNLVEQAEQWRARRRPPAELPAPAGRA